MVGEQQTLTIGKDPTPEKFETLFKKQRPGEDLRVEINLGLLRQIKNIASSDVAFEVFMYSLRRRAFTAKMAINELDIPESSFYRGKKRLLKEGFIVQTKKVPGILTRKLGKGGPKPVIYAVEGYTADDINKALHMHEAFLSEKFTEATKVSQLLMDDYVVIKQGKQEIQYKDIQRVIRERYNRYDSDFVDMIAMYLHSSGVKVWR